MKSIMILLFVILFSIVSCKDFSRNDNTDNEITTTQEVFLFDSLSLNNKPFIKVIEEFMSIRKDSVLYQLIMEDIVDEKNMEFTLCAAYAGESQLYKYAPIGYTKISGKYIFVYDGMSLILKNNNKDMLKYFPRGEINLYNDWDIDSNKYKRNVLFNDLTWHVKLTGDSALVDKHSDHPFLPSKSSKSLKFSE